MTLPLINKVCELVFGVNMFDLGFGVQIDSVKQPIKRDSVGSGHVSHHRRGSAIYDRFDHSFIVFRNVKHGFEARRFCVYDDVIHIEQFNVISVAVSLRFGVGVGVFALDFVSRVSPC